MQREERFSRKLLIVVAGVVCKKVVGLGVVTVIIFFFCFCFFLIHMSHRRHGRGSRLPRSPKGPRGCLKPNTPGNGVLGGKVEEGIAAAISSSCQECLPRTPRQVVDWVTLLNLAVATNNPDRTNRRNGGPPCSGPLVESSLQGLLDLS